MTDGEADITSGRHRQLMRDTANFRVLQTMIEKWKAHRTQSFLKLNTQSGSSMRQAEVRQKLTG